MGRTAGSPVWGISKGLVHVGSLVMVGDMKSMALPFQATAIRKVNKES